MCSCSRAHHCHRDAGAIRTRSRGNNGAVTMFDWNGVNGWEWGTILPDPLHHDVVYSSGNGVTKITYPSEQWINVSPTLDPAFPARNTTDLPIAFAPWDRSKLFAGFNWLAVTSDGGAHWTRISPDLAVPPDAAREVPPRPPAARDAIVGLALSRVAPGTIWVGTSTGFIHLTRDEGKTWRDVSIQGLPTPRRANISGIEASPFDAGTAYVAIDYLRLGDHRPHLYRTRDFGRTWTAINDGLPVDEPSGSITRVIRADPRRRGLLFAGTESGVHVSFDDGDHWQSLKLNMPDAPCWDLTIKDNDLIVGTYGRGIWVLDDYSVLRQLAPGMEAAPARLFAPPDTGQVVRHLSSAPIPPVAEIPRVPFPEYWLARPTGMPTTVGTNRINWDLRYDAPRVFKHAFEINANPGLTPASPEGPLALPGTYTVRLMVDGLRYEQPLVVRADPRSPATAAALRRQYALLTRLRDGANAAWEAQQRADTVRAAIDRASKGAAAEVSTAASALQAALDAVAGAERAGATTIRGVSATFVRQLMAQDNADHAPTAATLAAYAAACADLTSVQDSWQRAAVSGLVTLNAVLARHTIQPVLLGSFTAGACRPMPPPASPRGRAGP